MEEARRPAAGDVKQSLSNHLKRSNMRKSREIKGSSIKKNGKMQAKCRNEIFLMNGIVPRKIEYLFVEHKYLFQSFIKFRKPVTPAGISSDVQ